MNRKALLIAAALTAFVLVLVGGVVGRLAAAPEPAQTAPAPVAPVTAPVLVPAALPAGPAVAPAPVGEAVAIQAAQAYFGGEPHTVSLEEKSGILVYKVLFTDGSEVYVDAAGGQVVYANIANNGAAGQGNEYEEHREGEEHGEGEEHEHGD